ncbi:MAG: YaaR family protein [Clostridiaceae bacterium]
MKVNDLLSNHAGVPGMPAKDDMKVKPGRNADFRSHLAKAEENNYEQHLEKLVKDIVSQGETLAKRIDVKELRTYRRLIAEFLDLALGNSKKFSKQNLLDRRGRRKVYAIIKNVNEELDLLTQDVMNGEKENINLLKRLDDIRGLILDLLM